MARPQTPRAPSPRADAERRRRADADDAPWLEEGEHAAERTHTLVGRWTFWGLLFVLAALAIGVVVGILLVGRRDDPPVDVPAIGEAVPVLASPGPWKVAPSGPDVEGEPVEGQGQLLFGTGEGKDSDALIALDALPEDPLPPPGSVTEPAAEPAPAESPMPTTAASQAPAAPGPARPAAGPKTVSPPEPEATAASRTVQLGAFSSEGRARAAFAALAKRFSYLAGLEPVIVPLARDGETLYRLRTTAADPAAARDICAKLRVAGEACSPVT